MRVPYTFIHEQNFREDSAEVLFIEKALTYVETEAYNVELPPLKAKMFIPWNTRVDPGAKFYEYYQYTRTGVARLVTSRGQDLPTTNVFVKNFSRQFYRLGASYEYTLDDLLASQFAARNAKGPMVNVDTEKAIAAREAIDKGHDVVAAVGSATSATIPGLTEIGADVGLLGLLNQPNATTHTVVAGASTSTAWSTKTPDEKIADLTGMYATVEALTAQTFVPDSYLLPITQYRGAAGQRAGDGSDESVISLFKKMYPGVSVDAWLYCQGAGVGGVDRAVAYVNNERRVKYVVSEEFRQLPPQWDGMTLKVGCVAKTAGIVAPYPIAIVYADGI